MSDIIMKTAAPAMPPLIPKPARYEAAPGAFDLRRHEILVLGGAGSLSPPERALVETAFAGWDAVGLRLGFTAGRAAEGGPESAPEAPRFVVALDPGRAGASGTAVAREAGPPLGRDESYAIAITPREARIEAAGAAGVSLAFRTLAQLAAFAEPRLSLPCCRIEDCPAAAVRGFMHDVARNFQELPTLEAQIDLAASYKLNLFQWHLTDYHAWRIESRRFPSLNSPEVGPRGRRPERHYSYAEIRGLIAYAKARNVFVMPEIEMPGHSTAFRKALGFRMESRRGMRALEAILGEFRDEVPVEDAPIVHIGSEEIRIPNARAFLGRIVGFLESRGRRVMLWSPGLGRPRGALLQAWDAEGAPAEEACVGLLPPPGGAGIASLA